MDDSNGLLLTLEKYVGAFLTLNPEKVKDALHFFPTTLMLQYDGIPTKAKKVMFFLFRLEKRYQSLQFSCMKRFFVRQENLADLYRQLKASFATLLSSSKIDLENENINAFMKYFVNFCEIRWKLLSFYINLPKQQTLLSSSTERLYADLENIKQSLTFSGHPIISVLSPISNYVGQELDLLTSLLNIQFLISNLQFLSSLLCFTNLFKSTQTSEITPTQPNQFEQTALFAWFCKFRNALLSKFSLYWFDILKTAGSTNDLHKCIVKETPDTVIRISNFTKNPEVAYVALFFDARLQDYAYLGHSYVMPGTYGRPPKGIDSFPPIFTMPENVNPLPETDRSVIVGQVSGMIGLDKFEQPTNILHIAEEEKLHKMLFFAKLESRVYMVVAYNKNQTNFSPIYEFINSIRDSVQLVDVCKALLSA